jgi:CheY-like chemotaxis protein
MSGSILVVDDEPDVADLFRQHFRREVRRGDYVMHFAASGEQALERLSGEIEPQLIVILSDINMPGMDGLTLLHEVKQRLPDLPVMMVTAYGDDERRRRAGSAREVQTAPIMRQAGMSRRPTTCRSFAPMRRPALGGPITLGCLVPRKIEPAAQWLNGPVTQGALHRGRVKIGGVSLTAISRRIKRPCLHRSYPRSIRMMSLRATPPATRSRFEP